MEAIALTLLVASALAGFVAIFFTPVGTLTIMLGVVVYALMTSFAIISLQILILLVVLYGLGELIEFIAIAFGAKMFGASNKAVLGAIVGGVLGAILGVFFFGIGVIVGAFLGIFVGAFSVEYYEHKDVYRSLKAGAGGVVGRVGAIGGKVVIALVMMGVIAVNVYQFYF